MPRLWLLGTSLIIGPENLQNERNQIGAALGQETQAMSRVLEIQWTEQDVGWNVAELGLFGAEKGIVPVVDFGGTLTSLSLFTTMVNPISRTALYAVSKVPFPSTSAEAFNRSSRSKLRGVLLKNTKCFPLPAAMASAFPFSFSLAPTPPVRRPGLFAESRQQWRPSQLIWSNGGISAAMAESRSPTAYLRPLLIWAHFRFFFDRERIEGEESIEIRRRSRIQFRR
nr:hypothetical protein B296_00030300 [Ipomoea batatas]